MGLHVITFPVDDINPTTTIQLIITLEMHAVPFGSYNATDKGLTVHNYGKQTWEYDPDDPFIVPSAISMEFVDRDLFLWNLLFGSIPSPGSDYIQKDGIVEMQLNGSTQEFLGNIISETIEWDAARKILRFTAIPKVDIINETVLLLDDDTIVNPFGYSSSPTSAWPSLQTIVEDIFGLINSSIVINFFSDIECYNAFDPGWFPFIEHQVAPNDWFLGSGYMNELGIKTAANVLRKMAFEWGQIAGVISNDLAFFKEFRLYDSSNTMTLGTLLNEFHEYRLNAIKYIRITAIDGRGAYEVGNEENAGISAKFVKDNVATYVGDGYSGMHHGYFSPNTYWVSSFRALHIGIIDQDWHIEFLGDYYWYFMQSGVTYDIWKRVDTFVVAGVNYRIDKSFTHNSVNYNPMLIEKDYTKNKTRIEAVRTVNPS